MDKASFDPHLFIKPFLPKRASLRSPFAEIINEEIVRSGQNGFKNPSERKTQVARGNGAAHRAKSVKQGKEEMARNLESNPEIPQIRFFL